MERVEKVGRITTTHAGGCLLRVQTPRSQNKLQARYWIATSRNRRYFLREFFFASKTETEKIEIFNTTGLN